MNTVFDFGMYDASDTIYYLENGFRVVAVEANPALVAHARQHLKNYVESGQLELVEAAIGQGNELVELTVCGDDTGSSSIYEGQVEGRIPLGKFTVPSITTGELLSRYGTPYYLKIDLEGADRLAVLALTPVTKPDYLSFELNGCAEELIQHAASIGFTHFKLINQCSFREASNRHNLRDRISGKLVRILGYAEPQYVRRSGRLFKLAHSSGPAPWCSDGPWCSRAEVLERWTKLTSTPMGNTWYDLHAH